GPSRSSRRCSASAGHRSTCASRSCTTPTSWPTWNGAGRCSWTSFPRSPTGRAWCSPRTASPRPSARRRPGAAWTPSTRPARWFAAEGYLVALIGHAGHEEVEGTLGEAPEATALVESAADVARLRPADPGKVAYLMQTTLAVDEAADVAAALTERFPAARAP